MLSLRKDTPFFRISGGQDFWKGERKLTVAHPPGPSCWEPWVCKIYRDSLHPPVAQGRWGCQLFPPPRMPRYRVGFGRPITSRGGLGGFHRLPPPQPHPGAAGRKSGKSCRDLAKCPGGGGGEGAWRGIPAVVSTGQSERSCHPSPSPGKRNDPISGQGGGFRGQRGEGAWVPSALPRNRLWGKNHQTYPGSSQIQLKERPGKAPLPKARGYTALPGMGHLPCTPPHLRLSNGPAHFSARTPHPSLQQAPPGPPRLGDRCAPLLSVRTTPSHLCREGDSTDRRPNHHLHPMQKASPPLVPFPLASGEGAR